MAYDHKVIEPKWQKFWDEKQVFRALNDSSKPKYYVLDMFPYPSSSGLHVGHPEGYTATDIVSRFKRARGFNVLHPMGWDAFGLPAEQYAIKTGVHPSKTTNGAIETFRRQLKSLGFSFDWSREISTCDPKYYRWTQHIFLKLYEKGLAYQKEVPVNWCPALKTVLANEEVIDGKSERGDHPVFRVPMKQWLLKITAYADRLLADLDALDWPESTKELQRNWIGRSEGARAVFTVAGTAEKSIEIFTTRPDTMFGATFMVLAPEHPLVDLITTAAQRSAVTKYKEESAQKSEVARQSEDREKTGVWTGAFAINPVNGEQIPVWIADYVMMGYGTGAIMAVPAHDERDFHFAKKYSLEIRKVVHSDDAKEGECFTGEGVAVHSDFLNGKGKADAISAVCTWLESKKLGTKTVQYRLRDWLFSRQRYWGEPIPVVYLNDGTKQPLPFDVLPVVLPPVESYEPTGTGESPLAAVVDWVNTLDPATGAPMRRETDTMPGSAGSSWYFLRFCDPHNDNEPWSKEAEKYWMPVDLYLGGPEHAVGHLLYARFWTKVLFDAGLVSHSEPFKRLVHQGMILGEDGEKMSKSRGNVINPDDVVARYGADTLRLYEMFMGPLERDKPWSTQAIEGVSRFAHRVYRLVSPDERESTGGGGVALGSELQGEPTAEDIKILHKTIRKVTEDIEAYRFNTAISQLMIFVNHFTKAGRSPRSCMKVLAQLLAPFTPHLAEELWELLGERELLSHASWPTFDPALAKDDVVTIAIQVLGKTRGTIEVDAGSSKELIEEKAREVATVARQLEGKTIEKIIYVPNRILNFVVR